jgi:hypothetical protein
MQTIEMLIKWGSRDIRGNLIGLADDKCVVGAKTYSESQIIPMGLKFATKDEVGNLEHFTLIKDSYVGVVYKSKKKINGNFHYISFFKHEEPIYWENLQWRERLEELKKVM